MIEELYPRLEYLLAAAQLVLAMVGMGATLTVRDFLDVFKSPRGLSFGILAQLLLVPALAWGVAGILGMPPGVATGLVLVAAMPGGAMSNVFTYLGRGNVALSISMTAVSTTLCLVTAPLILRFLARGYLPPDFDMPTGMVILEIGWSLLLPLTIGLLVGHYAPKFKESFSKYTIRASVFFMVNIILASLGSGRIQVTAYGLWVPVAVVAFAVAAQIASLVLGWVIRLTDPDNLAVGVEVTVRNINLALLLKASLFPIVPGGDNSLADAVLFVILYYGGTSLTVVLLPVFRHRLGHSVLPLFPRRVAASQP